MSEGAAERLPCALIRCPLRSCTCSMLFYYFIHYQYIMSKLNDMKFAQKVCEIVKLLGGQSDIISSISGWRDHLSDEDVFGLIDLWIDATLDEQKKSTKQSKMLRSK